MTKSPKPTKDEALKPCPFCGGKPEKIKKGLDERYAYADQVTYRCTSCGCSRSAMGDTSKRGYADNSTVEQRALAAWNIREALAQPAADDKAGGEEWPHAYLSPSDGYCDDKTSTAFGWFLRQARSGNPCWPDDALLLYTHPQPQADQPAERVELTDEWAREIAKSKLFVSYHSPLYHAFLRGVRMAEAAHGITAKDKS